MPNCYSRRFLLIWLLFLVSWPLGSWGQSTCTPNSSGLLLRLPLNEVSGTTAQDVSGNYPASQLQNGGIWHPTEGIQGSGCLELPGSASLEIPISSVQPIAFTIAFWTKPTQLTDWNSFVGAKVPGRPADANQNPWGAFAIHTDALGRVYAGTQSGDANNWIATPAGTMQLQQWQQYVFTYSNNTGALYRNGVLLARNTGMPTPLAIQSLLIGGSQVQTRCPFQGYVDEVLVYERVLSDSEAADLYRCQRTAVPVSCPALSLAPIPTVASSPGSTTPLRAVAQQAGAALAFDGIDDLVTTTDVLGDVSNNFTVEAWVNPTATHEVDNAQTDGVNGIYNQRYLLFPTNGDDKFGSGGHAGMGISVGTNGVSVYEHAGGYMPPLLAWAGTLSGWTHIAVVYRDRQPFLYVNGLPVQTGLRSTKQYVHPSLGLGGGLYGYYQGQADEVRIWRTARTQPELQAYLHKPVSPTTANLVCYLRLDEGRGNTLADATGNAHNGVLEQGSFAAGGNWMNPTPPSTPTGPEWVPASAVPLADDVTYSWSPAMGLDQTTSANVNARPAATTTYTVTATNPCGQQAMAQATITVTAPASLPPDNPDANLNLNWTLERSFDGNDNVVAESKQFIDGLGRSTQAQARNAATKQVFASQTIYNTAGGAVLQTLAAPTNNQSFNYKADFVTAAGATYGPANFEAAKANQPDAVDAVAKGTLGYYFSQANTTEPLTPITSYPYSLTEPYESPLGGTRRAVGPGDVMRMGSGYESKGRDFLVRREFDAYLQLRPQYVPGSPAGSLEYQATKAVSVNADGREVIVVSNKEGQALISCLSGPQYVGVDVYGHISSQATNPFDPNAPAYQDVHIPAAGAQEVKFTMGASYTAGGRVLVRNLLTEDTTSYAIHAATPGVEPERRIQLEPGFYRFTSVTGAQWSIYRAHYGDFSYTYYDDAGRVVATITPKDLTGENLLRNSGFEQDAPQQSGWQVFNDGRRAVATYAQSGGGPYSLPMAHGGQSYGVHYTSDSRGHDAFTFQTFTNLPNGLYTARAWVKNSGITSNWPTEKATLLAKGYDTANSQREVTIPITGAYGDWVQVEISNIAVSNGQCTVGVYSIGPADQGIGFDDVEFVPQPDFSTRHTYDTSSRLLATESADQGRAEYVYARDGRIRFSQSALQRKLGRFSYSNYDDIGRVVESGEYTQATGPQGAEFQSHLATSPTRTVAFTTEQEAEDGIFYNTTTGHNQTVTKSGATFVNYLVTAGDHLQFTITVPQAGSYSLRFQYATGRDLQTLQLVLNNAATSLLTFPTSGDWNTIASHTVSANLQKGVNTIDLQMTGSTSGFVDVDKLVVSGTVSSTAPTSFTTQQEAEDGIFYNTTTGHNQTVTKSGATFVNYLVTAGDHLQFTITVPQAGSYSLRFRYATGRDLQTMQLVLNNAAAGLLTFPTSGDWNTIASHTVSANLQKGVNTIDLQMTGSTSGFVDVDKLVVSGFVSSTASPALTHDQSVLDILEDRTRSGGLDVSQCAQRNQVWYDLPWDGTLTRPDGTVDTDHQDTQLNGRVQEFVVGAVAKTKNDNVTTWYSYDELGRVTWVVQDIAGVGVKTLDYQYDFSGNVLEVAYQKGQADSFFHYYTYDAAQRLTAVYTSPTGASQTLQAEYSYYLHGPLKRVQVAGNLQGMDYVYTLQGALKSINHINQTLEPGHDAPNANGVYKDLFALTLDYFNGDYRSRALDVPGATTLGGTTGPVHHDGSIQAAAWRTAADAAIHRTAYTYDAKSQLQDAQYGKLSLTGTSSLFTPSNALRESGMRYDANGNILSLQRTDQGAKITDDFVYSYKPKTNQLQSVHAAGAPNADPVLDYDYDELGQMTRQRDELGQHYFTYDVSGKTTGVYLDEAHNKPLALYAYDDRGFRVRKTVYPTTAAAPHVTTYVRDVAGNLLALYEQATAAAPAVRSEVSLYGTGRLGTLTRLADGQEDYRYELTDHLGDARVVFHRPTTTVQVETMELRAVNPGDFQQANLYRVAATNAPSGQYVARLTDSQAPGYELKRVLDVAKGDTITFSALAQWKQDASTGGSGATPLVLLGAATGINAFSQRGADGQTTVYPTTASNWLSQLAAGLGFTLGQGNRPTSLGASSLMGWIKYRVLDASGNPMLDAQGNPLAGVDYLLGTGKWEYLQTAIRVPENGTIEVLAGTTGTGAAVYFDNLRVEQTGGLIVQEQHQYAFGAPLPGLSYTVGNKRYRYGYQGQYAEHDEETGFESFEARLYNSRIGRWLSPDAVKSYFSPYPGMGNNPVKYSDSDGRDIFVINYGSTGSGAQIGLGTALKTLYNTAEGKAALDQYIGNGNKDLYITLGFDKLNSTAAGFTHSNNGIKNSVFNATELFGDGFSNSGLVKPFNGLQIHADGKAKSFVGISTGESYDLYSLTFVLAHEIIAHSANGRSALHGASQDAAHTDPKIWGTRSVGDPLPVGSVAWRTSNQIKSLIADKKLVLATSIGQMLNKDNMEALLKATSNFYQILSPVKFQAVFPNNANWIEHSGGLH